MFTWLLTSGPVRLIEIHTSWFGYIYVIRKKKEKERRGMKDLAWSKFNSTDVLWTKNRSLS